MACLPGSPAGGKISKFFANEADPAAMSCAEPEFGASAALVFACIFEEEGRVSIFEGKSRGATVPCAISNKLNAGELWSFSFHSE